MEKDSIAYKQLLFSKYSLIVAIIAIIVPVMMPLYDNTNSTNKSQDINNNLNPDRFNLIQNKDTDSLIKITINEKNNQDFKSLYLNNPNESHRYSEIIALKDVSMNSMSDINFNIINSVFNPVFYESQEFDNLYYANINTLENFELSKIADFLYIGTINKSYLVTTTDNAVTTCTILLNLKKINLKNNLIVNVINETSKAIGFNENESAQNAIKKLTNLNL